MDYDSKQDLAVIGRRDYNSSAAPPYNVVDYVVVYNVATQDVSTVHIKDSLPSAEIEMVAIGVLTTKACAQYYISGS